MQHVAFGLSRRFLHAFSLIETAIVLAVVGLVIGGIWIAASTVQRNMKLADDLAGFLQIHSAMRTALASMAPVDGTNLGPLIYRTVTLPASWQGLKTNFGLIEASYEVVDGTPGMKLVLDYANSNCVLALRHLFPKLASNIHYYHNESEWHPITPGLLVSEDFIEREFCYDQLNYGAAMSIHLAF